MKKLRKRTKVLLFVVLPILIIFSLLLALICFAMKSIQIGNLAFYNCDSLTSVTIPNNVLTIGDMAFYACDKLNDISVDRHNLDYISENGVLFNKDKTVLIQYPAGKTDSSYVIPDSVVAIADNAFYNCDSLTSVVIPNSVVSIGAGAFNSCEILKSVTIPNSVTSIDIEAFGSCNSLNAIIVDENNEYYSSENGVLFDKNKKTLIKYPVANADSSYVIPDSVTSISEWAFFDCYSLTDIVIPNSVKSIGKNAFVNCRSLKSVMIPKSVTTIGDATFHGCISLKSVKIPNSVTSIGASAFEFCSSLKSVTIPYSVTSIGGGIFSNCDSLTAINVDKNNTKYSSKDGVLFDKGKKTLIQYPVGKKSISYIIPSTVECIGAEGGPAFVGCRTLKNITIPESVIVINDNAFNKCGSLISINIPNSVDSIGAFAFKECYSLTAINVNENNTKYSSENGVLFDKNKETLIQYPTGRQDSSYSIPGSVTSIGKSAFYNCISLKSVTIPDSVASIGDSAFYMSGLTSITIPKNVSNIEFEAFSCCTSLNEIIVDENNEYCSSENGVLFDKSKKLLAQYPAGKAGGYSIPDTVEEIGEEAFYGCSLTSVTIPEGVFVGDMAFAECSKLTSVQIS